MSLEILALTLSAEMILFVFHAYRDCGADY